MKFRTLLVTLTALAVGVTTTGCSSSDDGAVPAAETTPETTTTFSITGNLAQSSAKASLKILEIAKLAQKFGQSKANHSSSTVRTACSDGFFYSVYCLSYTSLTAAEGAVDCTDGGAFEVAGLPKGEAIGCFVHRFSNATDEVSGESLAGTVQIPASNLNGTTEQMVSSGDVDLAVTIGSDGTINAQVVSGTVNDNVDDGSSSLFTADNINGEWYLSCDASTTGSAVAAGACKCFLGDLDAAGYTGPNNERDCLNDGAAGFSGAVGLGVALYVYEANVNSDLEVGESGGPTLPAGSTVNAISIWGSSGSPGSLVSTKGLGGEGATDIGGALTWKTDGPDNPVTAVAWAMSVDPGDGAITIPAPPAVTATHAAWVTWAQAIMVNSIAADAVNYACSYEASNPEDNIWCINQALDRIGDLRDAALPRLHIMPFCDQNGCIETTNAAHSGNDDVNAFKMARVEVRGLRFPFSQTWTSATDNDALTPDADGIGIEPESRFVFEPLEFFPGGAGFRQSDHNQRHYRCGATTHDVQSSSCEDAGDYYELRCFTSEELSIKFLGSSSPMDVVFDSHEVVGHAELVRHTSMGIQPVTNSPSPPIDMCKNQAGSSGSLFTAKATQD